MSPEDWPHTKFDPPGFSGWYKSATADRAEAIRDQRGISPDVLRFSRGILSVLNRETGRRSFRPTGQVAMFYTGTEDLNDFWKEVNG